MSYLGAVNPTPNVASSYDPYFPRLASMADGTGTTAIRLRAGRLAGGAAARPGRKRPLSSSAVTSAYDALGRLGSTVEAAGAETFAYDPIGRLTTHTNDLGAFALGYLGETGQITSRAPPARPWPPPGATSPTPTTAASRASPTPWSNGGPDFNYSYTTTPENFISSITEASDASAVYPAAGSQTATYNNLNQLTNLSGQAVTFDAVGNVTSDGQRTYTWDAENRLAGITYPGVSGKATAFTYDGLGRRLDNRQHATGRRQCHHDVVPMVRRRHLPGAQRRQHNHPQLLRRGRVRAGYAEPKSFTTASTRSAQCAAPSRAPRARRLTVTILTAMPLQATAPVTDFVYAGMFFNADSGLYLTKYRAYDPVSGRWLSRDPLGEDADPSKICTPMLEAIQSQR